MGGEVAGAEGGEGRRGGDEGREYDCSDHGCAGIILGRA